MISFRDRAILRCKLQRDDGEYSLSWRAGRDRMAVARADRSPLLYAWADQVSEGTGDHALMDIELIEPRLFLEHASVGGRLFAETVRDTASKHAAYRPR